MNINFGVKQYIYESTTQWNDEELFNYKLLGNWHPELYFVNRGRNYNIKWFTGKITQYNKNNITNLSVSAKIQQMGTAQTTNKP